LFSLASREASGVRVLVTGHQGYIGTVLSAVLRQAGCDVVGLDSGLYGACEFGRVQEQVPSFEFDLRDVEFADLLSFDAVIHLAGLSNDECGDRNATLTESFNYGATIRLAECCKKAGVSRFLFASSCSVYGRDGAGLATEDGPVRPLGHYAKAKRRCEKELSALADGTFSPAMLRLATVYGVSPRLRLDTVVNDFVAAAVTTGRILMKSNGLAWRPLIHVEDAARVFLAVLTAPAEQIHNQVFNVAAQDANYRVVDVADAVTELVPGCTRQTRVDGFDPRSYRADVGKLQSAFPKLRLRWSLAAGIRQLATAFRAAGLTPGDWRGDRFRRAARIKGRIKIGELDSDLRCPQSVSA
jgi:nucleoside-diphosphate-sugar epimerase